MKAKFNLILRQLRVYFYLVHLFTNYNKKYDKIEFNLTMVEKVKEFSHLLESSLGDSLVLEFTFHLQLEFDLAFNPI